MNDVRGVDGCFFALRRGRRVGVQARCAVSAHSSPPQTHTGKQASSHCSNILSRDSATSAISPPLFLCCHRYLSRATSRGQGHPAARYSRPSMPRQTAQLAAPLLAVVPAAPPASASSASRQQQPPSGAARESRASAGAGAGAAVKAGDEPLSAAMVSAASAPPWQRHQRHHHRCPLTHQEPHHCCGRRGNDGISRSSNNDGGCAFRTASTGAIGAVVVPSSQHQQRIIKAAAAAPRAAPPPCFGTARWQQQLCVSQAALPVPAVRAPTALTSHYVVQQQQQQQQQQQLLRRSRENLSAGFTRTSRFPTGPTEQQQGQSLRFPSRQQQQQQQGGPDAPLGATRDQGSTGIGARRLSSATVAAVLAAPAESAQGLHAAGQGAMSCSLCRPATGTTRRISCCPKAHQRSALPDCFTGRCPLPRTLLDPAPSLPSCETPVNEINQHQQDLMPSGGRETPAPPVGHGDYT